MTKHTDSAIHRLTEAVLSTELPEETRLLVAVSGGPDSVALLHVMQLLSRWSICIGHVNHSLRASESDEDEHFVLRLGEQLGAEVRVRRVNVRQTAEKNRMSIETAARQLRWQALREMLYEWPGNFIVTGHTLNDQAETLLMRLMRGSGIVGLRGMQSREGNVIRPFLQVRREVILDYLTEEGISFRTDSSNLVEDHLRNRLRSEVLPTLLNTQPKLLEVLGRTGRVVGQDADFVLRAAHEALAVMDSHVEDGEVSAGRGSWLALHPALQAHTLRCMLQSLMGKATDVEESHIALISSAIKQSEDGADLTDQLPRGLAVYVDNERFSIRQGHRTLPGKLQTRSLELPGEIELEAGTIAVMIHEREALDLERLKTVCGPLHALCDADRVGESVVIRSRRDGDRMRPLGSSGSTKIKEILIDRHVPREVRDLLPVVEREGSIVWLAGVFVDDSVRVTGDTARIAHFVFRPSTILVTALGRDL